MILRDDQIVCRCKSGTSTHRRRAHHSKMPLAMWRTSLTTRNDGPWWARYRQTFWQPVGALPGQISDYHRIIVNYHHHGTQPFLVPIASLTRLNRLDLGWSPYRAMKLPHPWPYCYKRTTTESLGISGWSTFWLRRHPNIIQLHPTSSNLPQKFFFSGHHAADAEPWVLHEVQDACDWKGHELLAAVCGDLEEGGEGAPQVYGDFEASDQGRRAWSSGCLLKGALRQRVLMGNMMNRCEFWGYRDTPLSDQKGMAGMAQKLSKIHISIHFDPFWVWWMLCAVVRFGNLGAFYWENWAPRGGDRSKSRLCPPWLPQEVANMH